MPHEVTYSRVLGHAVDVDALERVIGAYLSQAVGDIVQVTIDGKTLRGTIPPGTTQGVHPLAAYVPEVGVWKGALSPAMPCLRNARSPSRSSTRADTTCGPSKATKRPCWTIWSGSLPQRPARQGSAPCAPTSAPLRPWTTNMAGWNAAPSRPAACSTLMAIGPTIENQLHYPRDVTFGEDRCRLRMGCAARVMATLKQPGARPDPTAGLRLLAPGADAHKGRLSASQRRDIIGVAPPHSDDCG